MDKMIESAAPETTRVRVKKKSQGKMIWNRFRKNKLAMVGLVIILIMAILSASAGLMFDYQADGTAHNYKIRRMAPGSPELPDEFRYILGTDDYGRSMAARIFFGGRTSLSIGFAAILLSMTVGAMIGASAGYYGGRADNIIMRIMDIFLAIPNTLLAISIVAALGGSLINLLIAMSISSVPRFARIIRSSILSIKGQEYIEAAKACGTGDLRIILKHIIPNAIGPIIVQGTLNLASTVISISGLSFIGLGVPPPQPEWGSMLSEARTQMRYFPHLVIIPGIAIMLSVMGLNLMGDGLRDALDPRLKN